jgi:hypothetical protein
MNWREKFIKSKNGAQKFLRIFSEFFINLKLPKKVFFIPGIRTRDLPSNSREHCHWAKPKNAKKGPKSYL